MASSCLPSTECTIVNDEKFEEIYRPNEDAIRLVDDGRTCEKVKRGSFGCTLGNHSYSSSVHRIRIKIHSGHVFLGIRSRNIVPVPDELGGGLYQLSPSTYGWTANSIRLRNGNQESSGLRQRDMSNTVYTLILNCDKHRLSIVSENGQEKDEMDVDHLHAPFPWCLFVELSRVGGRASIVQSSVHKASSINPINKSSDVLLSVTLNNNNISSVSEKSKLPLCGGNACPHCGKCLDWYYDGNIDRDNELFERKDRNESAYEIFNVNRWHRRPNGPSVTCSYFYIYHFGSPAALHGFDICRCP